MQFTYGLTNRLYAKKDVAREVLSVALSQSYYTDAERGELRSAVPEQLQRPDRRPGLQLLTGGAAGADLAQPINLQADFRTEWDPDAQRGHDAQRQQHASRAATG